MVCELTISEEKYLPSVRTCYVGIVLFVVGFVILGVTIQEKLPIPAFIFGWAIAQISVLVITVAVCEHE